MVRGFDIEGNAARVSVPVAREPARALGKRTFDVVISPLFELLARNPRGLKRGDAVGSLADEFSLTDEDRNACLAGSGKLAFMNVVDWAHGRLKWAGLSGAPNRGLWQLTTEGVARHAAGPLTASDLARLVRGRVGTTSARTDESEARSDADSRPATPEVRIREAVNEIRADVALGVLERAAQLHPTSFERLVIQLLVAMGYAAKGTYQHTGRSGDGGVDGIILMDRLGLDRIYIQAKRLLPKNGLSPDDVRAFFGALQLRRAHRGVLCTSGKISDGTLELGHDMQ